MQPHATLRSKFVVSYERLLQGTPTSQIGVGRGEFPFDRSLSSPTSPKFPRSPTSPLASSGSKAFWDDLLSLDIDQSYLEDRLSRLDAEMCLGDLKDNLNDLFISCLSYLSLNPVGSGSTSTTGASDTRRRNALQTLTIFVKAMSRKNFGGWEIMEVYAGGVSESDKVFTDFVSTVKDLLGSETVDPSIRGQALKLALAFVCAVNELSPGAYFLRQDLYPSVIKIVTSSDANSSSASDSVVLMSLLSNYHRSDAANLNPYLLHMTGEKDETFLRSFGSMVHARAEAAVKAYRVIQDDTPPSLASSFTSALSVFTPDLKMISGFPIPGLTSGNSTPTDPASESFSLAYVVAAHLDPNCRIYLSIFQIRRTLLPTLYVDSSPPRDALILLPLREFLSTNPAFPLISIRPLSHIPSDAPAWTKSTPQTVMLPPAVLSLSSYILVHATSSGAPRAAAYAQLVLSILHIWMQNAHVVKTFALEKADIRLCRQRTPLLPLPKKDRPVFCSVLDCCILWLRHNLHKNLQASSYITCVYIVNHCVRFLHRERLRLDYHWSELWRALIGLLDYLQSKADSLKYISQIGSLDQLVIRTLAFVVHADFLPEPTDVHQLIYELTRAAPMLAKHTSLVPHSTPASAARPSQAQPQSSVKDMSEAIITRHTEACLSSLLRITAYYAGKFAPDERSVNAILRRIADEIGRDGVVLTEPGGSGDSSDIMQPETAFERLWSATQQADDSKFIRWACQDGLSSR